MRLLLALIPMASLVTGCLFGCGFDGEGDRTFRRGDESMILCTNGGYAAVLETRTIEGRMSIQDGAPVGLDGESGALAFTFTENGDGTVTTPELGGAVWESVTLDKTDLDHAHTQCLDLEARTWWTVE